MTEAFDRGECPRCGSPDVVHIVYGMLGRSAFPSAPDWVRFAGCVVEEHNRTCEACGHSWYDDRPVPHWEPAAPEA